MIALTNKTQTMLSFPRTTNLVAAICLDLIGESNVHYLSFHPEVLPKKKKESSKIGIYSWFIRFIAAFYKNLKNSIQKWNLYNHLSVFLCY